MTITVSTTTRIKKRVLLSAMSVVVIGFFASLYLFSMKPAAAITTPPDNCFAFSAGTITSYYSHQANDDANPACPSAVAIPSTIDGESVTTIGHNAFQERQLTALTLPSTLTMIGAYAFAFNQLTELEIPATVTHIGGAAFSLNQIEQLTLPTSVTSIDSYAFSDNLIAELTILAPLTTLSEGVFAGNRLTAVTIPPTVTRIGFGAFYNNRLTSIIIPESVLTIEDWVFGVNQLESVTVLGSPTVGDMLFVANTCGSVDDESETIISRLVPLYAPTAVSTSHFYHQAVGGGSSVDIVTPFDDGPNYNDAGQLFNPAQLIVRYVDQHGVEIAPSRVAVSPNDQITDYCMKTLLDVHNAPADADLLTLYYHQGDTLEASAPNIPGFTLVSPQSQSVTATADINTMTFVYAATETPVDPVDPIDPVDPGNPTDPTNPTEPSTPSHPADPTSSGEASTVPTPPNTGIAEYTSRYWPTVFLTGLLLTIAGVVLYRRSRTTIEKI